MVGNYIYVILSTIFCYYWNYKIILTQRTHQTEIKAHRNFGMFMREEDEWKLYIISLYAWHTYTSMQRNFFTWSRELRIVILVMAMCDKKSAEELAFWSGFLGMCEYCISIVRSDFWANGGFGRKCLNGISNCFFKLITAARFPNENPPEFLKACITAFNFHT